MIALITKDLIFETQARLPLWARILLLVLLKEEAERLVERTGVSLLVLERASLGEELEGATIGQIQATLEKWDGGQGDA